MIPHGTATGRRCCTTIGAMSQDSPVIASPTRTRFAPSPSGDLHLGNARTALLCWLMARRDGGQFVLRVEDTDAERVSAQSLASLQEDLRWLGLDWDEGPALGGDYGPYIQSARGEIYDRYYARLEAAGLSYKCFCSQRTLSLMRKRQAAAGQPPRYDGTCRDLPAEEIAAREAAGETPSIRFRVDPGRGVDPQIRFEDLVKGPQVFEAADIGDFIIRRSNGAPAFFFSNAIDDALMKITHVLRGEDHLSNTPRQLMLLRALGFAEPAYAHASLIVGDDGAPLSKRHGSTSVGDMRAAGYLPIAVVNQLARLGLSFEDNDLLAPSALAALFDPARLGRSPARYDLAQLRHWQQEAVAAMDDGDFADWLLDALPDDARAQIPGPRREAFAGLLRDNVVLPADAVPWVERLFATPPSFSEAATAAIQQAGTGFFDTALALQDADGADDVAFKPWAKQVQKASGVKGRQLFLPLRAALSGEVHGPELYRLWDFLGQTAARVRLQAARALAAAGGSGGAPD
jgi:nondiscriminating glutamyl-tRNA synthetase